MMKAIGFLKEVRELSNCDLMNEEIPLIHKNSLKRSTTWK